MKRIGELIHNRRKELHLTLEEVGNHVGVGKSTVRKWEQGMIIKVSSDKIPLLAEILQVSPLSLLPVNKHEEVFPYNDSVLNLKELDDDHKELFIENEFSEEEHRLIDLYRSATDNGKRNAFLILEGNQKQDTKLKAK